MSIQGLERLEVWKKSNVLAIRIYQEVLPLLPKEEKWSLSKQLRRATLSIPANIAEGHGRYYFQETVRFCYIARGSLEEAYAYIILARDLSFIPLDLFNELNKDIEELIRLINGYIAYLKRSKRGFDEPGCQIYLSNSDEIDKVEELDKA
ncbi:MAG: four helix bundle protein [Anaerolineales bacterium]|nr:four helix bundle protein [Anaerolineales bacterium]